MTYVDEAISSGLGSDQRAAPASPLSGQDPLPFVLLCPIGTEQPSDLSRGDTNVSGRDIGVSSNVLVQLAHEGHAEFPDLVVGLALGVKVCSSLATADVY